MGKLVFSIFFSLVLISGFSQRKQIDVAEINKLNINKFQCLDYNKKLITQCNLELLSFEVKFYQAFFDKNTGELRVIGQTWMTPDDGSGFPGIGVIKTQIENDELKNDTTLTTTTSLKGTTNNGFFDITFLIKKGDYLLFYSPSFSIKEFAISELLNNRSPLVGVVK